MTPQAFLADLERALDEYRFRDVADLVDHMDPTAFDLAQIRKTLSLLRRKRRFRALEQAASLHMNAGNEAPIIRRQWAQAVLDQNRVSQGLAALKAMLKKHAADPSEGPEIRGLIGRVYKQLYVNDGGADNMREAIAAYRDDWQQRRGDYRWHGINLAALADRAQRDGLSDDGIDPIEIARMLIEDIEETGATGVWDYATGMEACVALADCDAALKWLQQYVRHPAADAFEIGSTLRQLKEVWQLEERPCGDRLIPVLECASLQREGGQVMPMQANRVKDTRGFEAVWGNESYTYVEWIDTLYARAYAVARIKSAATGSPEGTGFLIAGSFLNPVWGDAPVMLTNSHVVSDQSIDEAPLRANEAVAEFTRLEDRPVVPLGPLLYSSTRTELDISVLRLTPPPKATVMPPSPHAPTIPDDSTEPQRVYVMGHPNGGELAFSLYDNRLAQYDKQYVRYRSPTEGGSSGSPVCNRQLAPFAIHHRAREEMQLNEGILLGRIRDATSNQPCP